MVFRVLALKLWHIFGGRVYLRRGYSRAYRSRTRCCRNIDYKEKNVEFIDVLKCVRILGAGSFDFSITTLAVLQWSSVAALASLRWAIIFAGRNTVSGVFANIKIQVCAVLVMSSGCARG